MIDESLHALARLLLRLSSPQRAHGVLMSVGGLLHPHGDVFALLCAGERISRSGTCLSRALAVAARAPQVEVVIGVSQRRGERLRAHAWLEVSGEPLDRSDIPWAEIARIQPARGLRKGRAVP